MGRRLIAIGLAFVGCALQACGDGLAPSDAAVRGDATVESSTVVTCADCARADTCCAAHTANPDSNCMLLSTCESYTGNDRLPVLDGCRYYLKVASTPPAPASCGPHPDAE
jgi:hypothetical protein